MKRKRRFSDYSDRRNDLVQRMARAWKVSNATVHKAIASGNATMYLTINKQNKN